MPRSRLPRNSRAEGRERSQLVPMWLQNQRIGCRCLRDCLRRKNDAAQAVPVFIRKARESKFGIVRSHPIACLYCGKLFRGLGLHLKAAHGKTAAEYRSDWHHKRGTSLVCESGRKSQRESAKRSRNIQRIPPVPIRVKRARLAKARRVAPAHHSV